jgi:hypothetical protein
MNTNAPRTLSVSVAPRTWGISEPWVDIDVPVTYRQRDHGLGWYVTRTDTGQSLGMLSKASDGGWIAYLLNAAYYSPVEATDIMVTSTQHHSHNAETWASGERITTGATRDEAAREIVGELVSRWAASLEDLVATARAPFLATRGELVR